MNRTEPPLLPWGGAYSGPTEVQTGVGLGVGTNVRVGSAVRSDSVGWVVGPVGNSVGAQSHSYVYDRLVDAVKSGHSGVIVQSDDTSNTTRILAERKEKEKRDTSMKTEEVSEAYLEAPIIASHRDDVPVCGSKCEIGNRKKIVVLQARHVFRYTHGAMPINVILTLDGIPIDLYIVIYVCVVAKVELRFTVENIRVSPLSMHLEIQKCFVDGALIWVELGTILEGEREGASLRIAAILCLRNGIVLLARGRWRARRGWGFAWRLVYDA